MKKNLIKDKSFDFALQIIKLYKKLVNEKKEYVLSKQLLRSGTAVGALIREAEHAQSKADFIHKMSIALKEANETEYWIDLLYKSEYLNSSEFNLIHTESLSMLKILITIVKSSKQNN
jgi:four helix bundle protein